MIAVAQNLYDHRELIATLAWKNVVLRYKQAYLGLAWTILKPIVLMTVFVIVRSFIGIPSGSVPYPVLAFAGLALWIFLQESISEGTGSIVSNAVLIRKIYFPREIFPVTAVLTKLLEFSISFTLLLGMMAWFGITPTWQSLWALPLLLYVILVSLCVVLVGSALNVWYRDVAAAIPVVLSVLMYLSPLLYPLRLVEQKLLVDKAAGPWSDWVYVLYTLNPMAGAIDSFQNAMLRGLPPNWQALLPGAVLVACVLPVSYLLFKRAEARFTDVI
ncbi:MAG: ABC transporter permease [Burkholderiaceae bacterium]|jgi:lipopolysaccharide transport system permease protein|nr:ABC transporter permease [Burkholderiaceae bacterium]